MRLSGAHIELRLPEASDADRMTSWENDPLNWLVSNTIAPYTKEQIVQFIEHENDLYADQQMRLMIQTKDGASAGCIDLYDFDPKNRRVGIGILIDPEHRGKGYGHEAITLLRQYCFHELEVHSMYAEVLESNESSLKLFDGAGFEKVGKRKDWLWDGRTFQDQWIFQCLKEE